MHHDIIHSIEDDGLLDLDGVDQPGLKEEYVEKQEEQQQQQQQQQHQHEQQQLQQPVSHVENGNQSELHQQRNIRDFHDNDVKRLDQNGVLYDYTEQF
jgi:hypothetical protein